MAAPPYGPEAIGPLLEQLAGRRPRSPAGQAALEEDRSSAGGTEGDEQAELRKEGEGEEEGALVEAPGAVVTLPSELHRERAHVLALTNRYPADGLGPACYWTAFAGGADGLTKVPSCRWDMDAYYSPDRTAHGSTYAMHGGFCPDASLIMFDNDFFGIPEAEAERMSPGQRVVLETGFEVLHRAGHSRETARGLSCGVFLGDSGNEWQYMCEVQDHMRILAQSNFVTGSRLSHCLGLAGPCSTVDTACSSSLVAACLAHTSMRSTTEEQAVATARTRVRTAVALGSNLLLSPRYYILYCGPGMLSPRGRCFTFDYSGDGFARGEGCGGILLHSSEEDEDAQGMLGCLAGSAANQDGRSASMTAPNGPAQQMCIRMSISEFGIGAERLAVAECHGTGTALGDPIEVSAIRAVMDGRELPILETSAKSNIGHLEAAAGMAGLIKCVLMLVSSSGAPNNHLRLLNPHMDVNGFPVYFESELCDYMENTGIAGVSSFGFGGTNARSDLWGRCLRGARVTSEIMTAKWLEERSMYFQRALHLGTPGPHHADRVCIVGTWDAYSGVAEMEKVAPGRWAVLVVLGEARREQFSLLLNKDHRQALHPAYNSDGQDAAVEGPDARGEERTWLIDGAADGVPAWTVYQVNFAWEFSWEQGDFKHVSWEATDQVAPPEARALLHRHVYSVIGSWTSWRYREMPRSRDEAGLWTTSVRLGLSGEEEFQFARDSDWSQTIHPALPRATSTGIPTQGPDGFGAGLHWLVRGSPGDLLRIQLRVQDGEVSVAWAVEAT